ncbi:MAG: acyl-CoA reductase [Chitinophagaceae bacterium]
MQDNKLFILEKLRNYMLSEDETWQKTIAFAEYKNPWFTKPFIHAAIQAITNHYLDKKSLESYATLFSTQQQEDKIVGITMAGNIPLVGFHDFLSVFLSPFRISIKLSQKDDILLPHLISKLIDWDATLSKKISIQSLLKNCDAYIATGSHASSLYFKQYFEKYPHIIRENKTSIALLDGTESNEELLALADDIFMYYGLGCRNVTKIYVPQSYNFENLILQFKKYDDLKNHNKYRNNYDYQLALYLLNNIQYMCNENVLLVENESDYSPVSVLHYSFYEDKQTLIQSLQQKTHLQTIVGHNFTPFGMAQNPSLTDFADGINTVEFLNSI